MNPTQKPSLLAGTEEMKMLAHLDLDIEELEQRLELAPLIFDSCGVNCSSNGCSSNGCNGNCASNCIANCSANCGADCSHTCTIHAC